MLRFKMFLTDFRMDSNKVLQLGCRHNSVESSAPTIFQYRLSFGFLGYLCCETFCYTNYVAKVMAKTFKSNIDRAIDFAIKIMNPGIAKNMPKCLAFF